MGSHQRFFPPILKSTETMNSQDAAIIEGDDSSQPPDDWSTASLFPEPSAPNERDLILYLASGHDGIRMEHEEETQMRVGERDFPPIFLPVGGMESAQPRDTPTVLYDYQRDRVMYSTALVAAPVGSERDLAYESMHVLQLSSENMVRSDTRTEKSNALASGVAGAVIGTLLLGTFPGIIAGFYAAYAHGEPGAVGDVSRALGEIALVAREKAIVIDNKHQLVARGKVALAEAWEYAKILDRQHHVIARIKDFAIFSFTMALHLIRRSNLLETNANQSMERQCRGAQLVQVSNSSEQRLPLSSRRHRQDSKHRTGAPPPQSNLIQARYF